MSENRYDTPRWRRIALPASIVLNLFFIALVGGHIWRASHGHEPRVGAVLTRALADAEARLPPKDAAAFGTAMRRDAPRFAEAQKQLVETRLALERQITAEQFSPEQTKQALEAWRTAWNHFFDDFSSSLVDAMSQISPEGRRKLIPERRLARGAPSSSP